MAKYTTPEVVERNLRQGYDDQYYQAIRNYTRFALGARFRRGSSPLAVSLTGDVPDDVDMLPDADQEPGQSRTILTNAMLMAAKVTHVEPDPDYPDKPRWKEIVTKAINRAIWKGRPCNGQSLEDGYGEWQPECQRAFMDFDSLGTGFVQLGVRDGWVTIQHHPLSRVIWDRHRAGISRARWIAFVHYLSEEESVNRFGSKIKDELLAREMGGQSLRTLKAVQWFDMGLGKSEPTEQWRLNTFSGRVLDIGPNEFGCLPHAYGEYMSFWGMRRAMGRIEFQMSDQQLRNALERYQRLVLERGPGFDVFDVSNMDVEDQERLESGELLTALRYNLGPMEKVENYVMRVAPHNPPEGLFRILDSLDRRDPSVSGNSDADKANVTSSPRTLGEIETVQEGANIQKNWSSRQYARFLERLFFKANYIAAQHHTAPTAISINGAPYLLNDPGVPQTNIEYWLTPNSWPVVNEDLLTKQAPFRRMQIAQGKWMPFLQDQFMNPVEVRRRMLEEMGEKDVDRYLNADAVAMSQGQAGAGGLTDAMAMTQQQPA